MPVVHLLVVSQLTTATTGLGAPGLSQYIGNQPTGTCVTSNQAVIWRHSLTIQNINLAADELYYQVELQSKYYHRKYSTAQTYLNSHDSQSVREQYFIKGSKQDGYGSLAPSTLQQISKSTRNIICFRCNNYTLFGSCIHLRNESGPTLHLTMSSILIDLRYKQRGSSTVVATTATSPIHPVH